MNQPKVVILILNYNGRRWLSDLYESLRADGYGNKRIYLVDNGSVDGSQELTRLHYPEVAILQLPYNIGYSMAYNLAMEVAFDDRCDWVIWQNNDTIVQPNWLDRMANVAFEDPRIGVMGPVFRDWIFQGPNDFMQKRYSEIVPFMNDVNHDPVDCDWVEGSALAVKRECVESVGPLDPLLFMYWEEVDFCRRALRKQWRVVLVPGSVVRHFGGGTSNQVNFNTLKLRNEYVYSLCNPSNLFLINALTTLRLFFVKMKIALKSNTPFFQLKFCIKVFLSVCAEIRQWRSKWVRDRRGEHPLKLKSGYMINLIRIK